MKKRILSAFLSLLVLLALVPVRTVSAISASELEEQVANTYRMARTKAGTASFDGYCAWKVNWELVILGINSTYVSGNGKDQFDNYKNRTQSNGGYYITAYPAADYDLAAALNTITNNGTTDACNILVGFEKSNTSLGSRYGHVIFIHGIVDGVAYFCESFEETIGGTTYPEGSVIACTIEEFARHYNEWTVLDGLIHFEKEVCDHNYDSTGTCTACGKAYPWVLNKSAAGTYKALQDFVPSAAPYTAAAAAGAAILTETEVEVAGSLTNAQGEVWYQLSNGFAPADALIRISTAYGPQVITCTVTSPAEGALVPRAAYPVKGTITSEYPLRKVQAWVDDELYATVSLGSETSLNIQNSVINHDLSFSVLDPGPHTLRIFACDIYREEMELVCERNFVIEGEVVCKHEYEAVTTPPDCESGGFTTYTCTLCGESYTADETAPLGHSRTYTVAQAPTLEAPGSLSGTCTLCGSESTLELPRLNRTDYTVEESDGLGRYTWNNTDYGSFTFEAPLTDTVPGDVNGDGEVTIADLMRLANHFAKGVEIDKACADVNADGEVTIADLMRLANFFAGKAQLG